MPRKFCILQTSPNYREDMPSKRGPGPKPWEADQDKESEIGHHRGPEEGEGRKKSI